MNGKASGTDSSLSCNDTIRAFLSKHQTKIEMAVRESQKSNHRHKLGAVIFKGKRIISNGFNKTTSWRRKLHPK
jgi:deoxycytidylate deaminase